MNKRSVGYWLASIGMGALAVAIFVYLGFRTLDFLQFTFREDQSIYAWLGLFTTSLGALIWGAVFKWLAEEGFQKALSLIMVCLSLLGELALAAADMFVSLSDRSMMEFTPQELKTAVIAAAVLAALHGVALFAFGLVDQEPGAGRATRSAPRGAGIPAAEPGGYTPVRMPVSHSAETEPISAPFDQRGNGRKIN